MANLSELTRKEQVLYWLRRNANQWVDGPDIANERIGGSEGLRRLRELGQEGNRIQQRRHPDAARDIWQYRLVVEAAPPLRQTAISDAVKRTDGGGYEYIPSTPEIVSVHPIDNTVFPEFRFTTLPDKLDFGAVAVCPRCHARTRKYHYEGLEALRHKDPHVKKSACLGCNGWGVVPNKGAITMTAPEGLI